MMKARQSPPSLSLSLSLFLAAAAAGYPRFLTRARAAMCIFSTNNQDLALRQHRQIHNESFYTV